MLVDAALDVGVVVESQGQPPRERGEGPVVLREAELGEPQERPGHAHLRRRFHHLEEGVARRRVGPPGVLEGAHVEPPLVPEGVQLHPRPEEPEGLVGATGTEGLPGAALELLEGHARHARRAEIRGLGRGGLGRGRGRREQEAEPREDDGAEPRSHQRCARAGPAPWFSHTSIQAASLKPVSLFAKVKPTKFPITRSTSPSAS